VPSIIHALLLFSLLQPAAPLPHVRIDLVFVGPIRPSVEATAMTEVTSIWAPYNVDIHASSADAVPDGVQRLAVIIVSHTAEKTPVSTLGAIRFRAGLPEPTILMYAPAIDTLVSLAPMMRSERECLPAIHDMMVGRAFGRALAHEVGHYLLRSRYHAPAGLMRAMHRSPDLIAAEREGFDLSPGELTRIAEVLSLSHE
jgi:hypothetical protein